MCPPSATAPTNLRIHSIQSNHAIRQRNQRARGRAAPQQMLKRVRTRDRERDREWAGQARVARRARV